MKKQAIFVLMVLLPTVTTQGAHFEYYAGGFTASCDNYSKDYYYISGPFHISNSGTDDVVVEDYSAVLQANTIARNSVNSAYGDHSVGVRVFSLAAAISLDSFGYAYSFGSSVTKDGQTRGIFYKIQPDSGENIGDEVIVYYTGALSIEPTGVLPGNVSGYLIGPGDMDHLAITKGELPPVTTEPDPINEVWNMPNLELDNTFYYGFEDVDFFYAEIGDIIGVFASTGTSNTVSGVQLGTVIANLTFTFTVESPLLGDLDGDGDVDFQDFAKFADNWLAGTTP